MFELRGKRVLITGSTQGIGLSIAKCFASRGAKIYINGATSMEKCIKAAKTVPESEIAFVNLLDNDCADRLYEITGDIDILVLNASIQYRKEWDGITSEEFDNQIKVNLKSGLELIQKYVPYMKNQHWGRILTIGSVQQHKPHKDMLIYAASKTAQMNMVINLAQQLAPHGITVNNIAPGVINTPRNYDALADKEYSKTVLSKIPCGYAGDESACDGAALLLCSEAGKYITGIDLMVDGGMHL